MFRGALGFLCIISSLNNKTPTFYSLLLCFIGSVHDIMIDKIISGKVVYFCNFWCLFFFEIAKMRFDNQYAIVIKGHPSKITKGRKN